MDSVKKQLRFFKILVVVLSVFVLAQCTFWISSIHYSSSSNYSPIPKVKALQHSKVVAPAVSGAIQFFMGITGK